MSILDDIPTSHTGFTLPGATPFNRLRATRTPDPYNPSTTASDWTNPVTIPIRGALASSTSTRLQDGPRDQTTSTAILTIDDPHTDIQIGDRIKPDPDDGRCWEVTGFPSNDVNAFTGLQPTLQVTLAEWKG
ncbi:hypothetical protein EP30_01090 [Bifidobacterium sp. UTCIF-39]|uniref:hypothetical protein n=1 Tax=Bifidobacterium sp. UTCIF-39 TaxID=1465359 RepID=UPI001126FA90|nr:hypothetical protein [Bifidobacterium sp. UTCIF-39]TPF97566.1 hypothetical protein EP30_01090 [Bifidobacterium sp. UTCIF-39]